MVKYFVENCILFITVKQQKPKTFSYSEEQQNEDLKASSYPSTLAWSNGSQWKSRPCNRSAYCFLYFTNLTATVKEGETAPFAVDASANYNQADHTFKGKFARKKKYLKA